MKRIAAGVARSPLSVARSIAGPIFQREVRALGRRRAPYWVRTVYTLLLGGLVGTIFSAIWISESGSDAITRQSLLQSVAPALLGTIAWVQLVGMALVAPVLTAGAIADEKRMRTLSSLLTTPLTSRDIVLGKLSSRLIQLLILALVPLPLLLALRVFGGLESEAILASLLLSLSVGLLGACLALMFGIWHRRTASIVFYAWCSTAVLIFAPVLVMFIVQWELYVDEQSILFRILVPVAMLMVLLPEDMGYASAADVRVYWLASLGYMLGLSALIAGCSIVVLRSVLRRHAGHVVARTGIRHWLGRLVIPPPDNPGGAAPRGDRPSRTVGRLPVLWREMHQTALGTPGRTLTAWIIGLVLLVVLWLCTGMHSGLTVTLLIILMLGLTLQAALTAPTSITAERDSGSWEILLTTPLPASQIVLGKALGSVRKLWIAPALVGVHVLAAMAFGWFHPIGALHAVLLLGSIVLMLAGTGVYLALVCKRSVTASVLNVCLPLTLFLGLPMGLVLMTEFFYVSGSSFFDDFMDSVDWLLFATNPFALITEAGITATADMFRFHYRLRYETPGVMFGTVRFTLLVLGCCAWMLALGGLGIGLSIARFNRLTGRPS
ncbi:MAG: hypothetical protein KatS3mg103_0144 [Phycisphaerales bacterium]|nr:MAG: hypothetical protein KatS3mg103_0144 [Phycisphaerales bacterium]